MPRAVPRITNRARRKFDRTIRIGLRDLCDFVGEG